MDMLPADVVSCAAAEQKPGFFWDEPLPCKPEQLPTYEARYLLFHHCLNTLQCCIRVSATC